VLKVLQDHLKVVILKKKE